VFFIHHDDGISLPARREAGLFSREVFHDHDNQRVDFVLNSNIFRSRSLEKDGMLVLEPVFDFYQGCVRLFHKVADH
jgi:hypothetical protein